MMKPKYFFILVGITVFTNQTLIAQDTLVGWTIPDGTKNAIANIGNELNIGGMFIEAARADDEIPFSSLYFSSDGYSTKCVSSVNWDSASEKKCWKFSCDATGYKLLHIHARISSDSTNPGPRDFKIQYRLGCCSPIWKDVPGAAHITVATNWTTGVVKNIAIPDDADSMSGFQVRFVCISDTATDRKILKAESKSLIDEVYVTGTKMTSISESVKNVNISLWPNPATSVLHISSGIPIECLRITDLSGNLLKEYKYKSNSVSLNTSFLTAGCYVVEVFLHGNIRVNKKLFIR